MTLHTDIHAANRMNPNDFSSLDLSSTATNSSKISIISLSTYTVWIGTKCSTNIHVPCRMNLNDFGDPLTFHLAPPSGQNMNCSNILVLDHMPTSNGEHSKHYLPNISMLALIVVTLACQC